MISEQTLKDRKPLKTEGLIFRQSKFDVAGLKSLHKLWTAHLHGLGDMAKELELPKDIETVIQEINDGIESLIAL